MTWLDLKLGVRMLVKYPGLTVVGGLAMAFAIWTAVITFQMIALLLYPTIPLPAGDRLVRIEMEDVSAGVEEERILHDYEAWRDRLRSVRDLGAWRDSTRNVIVDGDARPVQVAEMSASGFRVAGAEPLMGRVIGPGDERAGAPPVAGVGYDVWRTRFASDRDVIGRTIQLGDEHVTLVGVMREGFAFPISHDVWVPLRSGLTNPAPRAGPAVSVFGVLSPGETLETAQSELTAVGERAAADLPATHQHLRPHVLAYGSLFAGGAGAEVALVVSVYFFGFMLLILIFGNVGLLLFARAATRESEIVIRTALGASRARIVSQIFAEALVLGGLAAVFGIAAADLALRVWGLPFLEANMGRLPFWFDLSLSPATILFAIAFMVLGAAVAGGMTALKITRGMADRLKQTTAGSGGLQFGGIWSVVIVAQVAVTVAFPGLIYWEQFQLRRWQTFDPGFAAGQYLTVRIDRDFPVNRGRNVDPAELEAGVRFSARLDDLRARLAREPGIGGVTFTERLPMTSHPPSLIEMGYDAGASAPPATTRLARIAAVDAAYFDALQAPVLAGRAFTIADVGRGSRVVIVDQGFVDQVLQGRNPIGQQLRFVGNDPATPNPWNEVVGVVKELGVTAATQRTRAAGVYLPAGPDQFDEVYMLVHARQGDPMTLVPRIRAIATAVDPSLRLLNFMRATDVNNASYWVVGLWLRVTVAMSAVALTLSLAGIYAVLAFAVTRRTREIGIRVALGATRPGVIWTIFRRPLLQVLFGVFAGASVIFTVARLAKHTEFPGSEAGLSPAALAMLAGYALVMVGVCMLACIAPARRALAVEPTVALRADA